METNNNKEIVSKFLIKKEEAYEVLQRLTESNAPEADVKEATTMHKFWEIMEMEEGEELGALLYEFAVLVDFDAKLIKPIAYQDAGFWTDVESMGFLEFQLNRLQLERSTRTISLLQTIDISLKKLVECFDDVNSSIAKANTVDEEKVVQPNEFLEEYEKLPEEKEYNIPLEKMEEVNEDRTKEALTIEKANLQLEQQLKGNMSDEEFAKLLED